jgi:hypothetical protein
MKKNIIKSESETFSSDEKDLAEKLSKAVESILQIKGNYSG